MIAMPQVSCIVPAYNAERYLKQALESALAQSVEVEIIVVDDGSTDQTTAIASGFSGRVRVISQPNSGVAVARNRGLAVASAEFLAFLDSDDLWSSNKLKRQLAAFAEDPSLELCASHIQNFRGDLEPVGEAVPGYNTEMLIRRTLMDRVGPFATIMQHSATLDWMLRARDAKVVERLLPDTLSYRRLHQQNMSRAQASESLREHLLTLHASLRRKSKPELIIDKQSRN
jgi:glycosyltransferase involved in cell wall biosynthesis